MTAPNVQVFTVQVRAHSLPRPNGTLDIPAREYTFHAVDQKDALRMAVYQVADDNGVAGWKPWLRKIRQHTKVVAVEDERLPI